MKKRKNIFGQPKEEKLTITTVLKDGLQEVILPNEEIIEKPKEVEIKKEVIKVEKAPKKEVIAEETKIEEAPKKKNVGGLTSEEYRFWQRTGILPEQ